MPPAREQARERRLERVGLEIQRRDVTAQVVHGLPVTAGYMAVTILYGFVYIAMLLIGGALIFSRRDFK